MPRGAQPEPFGPDDRAMSCAQLHQQVILGHHHRGTLFSQAGAREARLVGRKRTRLLPGAVLISETELSREPATERCESTGLTRLVYPGKDGWRWWCWRGHAINYTVSGSGGKGAPFCLVHGFGANSYHWRYNVPALASAGHPTYALCLIGYGLSAKPAIEYSSELWSELVSDFMREVIGRPSILAGNSIGAIAALGAAYEAPELTRGVALLNAAGRLDDLQSPSVDKTPDLQEDTGLVAAVKREFRRWVVNSIFISTKWRIQPILKTVYVNKNRVDASLVKSIYMPACDEDAPEAFQRISDAGRLSKRPLTTLLAAAKERKVPLKLVWGMQDPWMQPQKAAQILAFAPEATMAEIADGGHCPHDDSPEQVNAALIEWAKQLDARAM